jgi:hypothetical protein
MKRISRLSLLAVVAVVALVLGSFGTATAGPVLSKARIKSIATKVVKKQAPSLSVANATNAANAGNANTVGGLTAGQLKTTQYQFRLPTQAAAASRTYSFPSLPAGNYSATYSILATGTSVLCYFQNGAGPYEAISYGVNSGGYTSVTNSAFLAVSSATRLNCAGSPFSLNGGGSISNVTFTPIDTPVAGTATGARPAEDSDDSGAARP